MTTSSTLGTFEGFTDWEALQLYVRSGCRVFYQAPLDYRPIPVKARVKADGRIAVLPPSTDVDPFLADVAHLARFKRRIGDIR